MKKAVTKTMHYMLERGPDGMPARLVWSSEIQAAGEAWIEARRAKDADDERMRRKPMAGLEDWAIKHGLWSDS